MAASSSSTSNPAGATGADSLLTASVHSSLMAKSMSGSLGGGNMEAEFTGFVERLGQLLTECEGMAMRALNRIPKENELMLTPEVSLDFYINKFIFSVQ
jgi:hypothetical protein